MQEIFYSAIALQIFGLIAFAIAAPATQSELIDWFKGI